jgi:aspartyl protease family protein
MLTGLFAADSRLWRIPRGIAALLLATLLAPEAPAVEKIVVLGLFRDRAILSIDGTQRVLVAGQESPEGVLLISADSSSAVIEFNGRRESYSLGAHIMSEFVAPAAGSTVMVAPDEQGMYRVNGSINGFQVAFIVDTGATLIAMNRDEATRIGIDYRMEGRESQAATASGIGRVFLVNLDSVRVGEIELKDVAAAVHDGEFPLVMLLGNSFLNRVDLQREGRLLQIRGKGP